MVLAGSAIIVVVLVAMVLARLVRARRQPHPHA